VHAGDAEQPGFAEGGAEELKAEGEGLVARGEAAGEADAGDGGDVARDGEDVAEVHLQRVAGLLAGLEGRGGARGAGDDVAPFERLVEVALDEGADLEGADVVGVVVA